MFLARNANRPYPLSKVHLRLGEFSELIDLRDEQGHRVMVSKTHTFRHTRATHLLNTGVPIHVAMHYAKTLATVAESEFLRQKKVTADGRDYQRDPAEMFEALALDKRTDRVLPNGYCTLPPRQARDKGNACLSCAKFVTDASFAEALTHQRDDTHRLVEQRRARPAARRSWWSRRCAGRSSRRCGGGWPVRDRPSRR